VGLGPVRTPRDVAAATREAVKLARAGGAVVIDARVLPGYNPTMTASLTGSAPGP
jgi:hypothetical protein